ncbi:hypothetical protein G7Y89_g13968 [Cudoniella acicularis]|uniref:TLDc domain-containing protein n=1 Tax=Cudoniella acicularis TaxID=354080 RepID=A0A8H4R8N7_9HELO|nr:hypothetical protein G7Y89_g13968 [Cudoniella acicularis]
MEEDPRIPEWEKAGLMTRERVMDRLHKTMKFHFDQGAFALRENFNTFAVEIHGFNYWNQESFINFLGKNSKPSSLPLVADAGTILFHLAQYLGSFPFRTGPSETSPPAIGFEELLGAIFWLLPGNAERSTGAGSMGDDVYMRARSAADRRRLLFESLADSKGDFAFDETEEKKIAAREALEVEPHLSDFTLTNYDEEDEMYHDVLDVLSYSQDFIQPPRAPCRRDALRALAKRLHTPTCLRQLAISRSKFKSLVKLMLVEHLNDRDSPNSVKISELESVADSIVNAFCHGSDENGMITWRNFDLALKQKAPFLFSSLYRLFSSLLKKRDEENEDYQAFLLPPLPPNHLLTPLVLGQLSFILDSTASFESAPLLYQYDVHQGTPSENATYEITSALKSRSGPFDFRILLISGKSLSTGEAFVFGSFIMDLSESLEIVPLEDDAWERSFLFQISPTHDVFRSNVGNAAWTLDDELWFGDKGKGMAMGLTDGVKKLKIAHDIKSEGVYQTTSWRGDWTLELEIDKIEVWGE